MMRLPVFFFIMFLSAVIFSPLPTKIFAVDSSSSASTSGPAQVNTMIARPLVNMASEGARPFPPNKVAVPLKDDIRERISSRSAALKEKLKFFRDKKKVEVVERVDANLGMVNQKRTDNFMKTIDRMSGILTRLEDRISKVQDKDTAQAKKAVDDAKMAVDEAKAAATAQGAKEYLIEATSEAKIKDEVRGQRDMLHDDLKTVHNQIMIAKKAVANAIETTAKTLGGVGNGQ